MQLEEYFDFLAPDDIRLKGTRVGIESVLYEYLHRRQTPEQIAARFYTLTLEQVYAAILYYLHNQAAVTAYLEDWLESIHRARKAQAQNPAPVLQKLRQLKAERKAKAEVELTPVG